jgi:4'-phosphopantetheinyl transferase
MDEEPTVHLTWATVGELPTSDGWLTEKEGEVYRGLRIPRRAADWRLGRWVAKGAVAAALRRDPADPRGIEVLASSGGAPVARLVGKGAEAHVALSLSHCGGLGFAAATPGCLRLGCDVETVEPRSEEFVRDYFTAEEGRWILAAGADGGLRVNLLWSAKESALKALGEGLRMDTRSVEVETIPDPGADAGAWRHLTVETPGDGRFPGLWRAGEGRVWTVVAERPFRLA